MRLNTIVMVWQIYFQTTTTQMHNARKHKESIVVVVKKLAKNCCINRYSLIAFTILCNNMLGVVCLCVFFF